MLLIANHHRGEDAAEHVMPLIDGREGKKNGKAIGDQKKEDLADLAHHEGKSGALTQVFPRALGEGK